MIAGIYKIYINKISVKKGVYDYYFDNLVKLKNLDTKFILIDQKNYKSLMIYVTIYVDKKWIKLLSLNFHELVGKIEEHKGKKYLMADGYMLNEAWTRLKNNENQRI